MVAIITEPLLQQNDREEEKLADDVSHLENGWPRAAEAEKKLQHDKNHGKSSFWQTTTNCLNVFLGMGLIALPSALQQGGWLSLSILMAFAIICCYTGILLGRCLASRPDLKSYHDIGETAYGSYGRMLVTVFLYFEIAAYLVGSSISVGDNLARIFPNLGLNIPWLDIQLEPAQVLLTIAVMAALPTVWLRDMSSLSFVSVGGVVTSLIVMGAVAWAGLFGGVGFSHNPTLLNIFNLPLVSGIYAYCYAAHIAIPNIYNGMQNPVQFPKVMVVATLIASVIYGGMAVIGASMFGDDIQSQVTLNIPKHLVVATIALWTAVLNPLSKFGLCLLPIAEQLENLLPFPINSKTHLIVGTAFRTTLMLIILAIALAVPFFQNMVALCGSSVSLTTAVTLPALLHLKIFRTSMSYVEIVCNIVCIVMGILFTIIGTNTSLRALIEKMSQ